jgi:predicted kinase
MSSAIVLLCGMSFSGKSTVASVIARELGAEVVSLDAINESRGLNGGDGIPISEWHRTHALANEAVLAVLAKGGLAVVDDTSSPRFLRDGWRDVASRAKVGFALVYLDIPIDELRRRLMLNRAERGRHDVTDVVFEEHVVGFDAPGDDEPHLVAPPTAGIPAWANDALRPALDTR